MRTHFTTMAAYNRWANRRLYGAVAGLSDEQFRQDRGAFFGSVRGTLNHLLVADRMWMHRLTGSGPLPSRLDEILHDDFPSLRQAREVEDERVIGMIDGLGDQEWDRVLNYRRASGKAESNSVGEVLAHFFNHHAHHRGQTHALITGFGHKGPELDLIYFLREQR